MEIHQYIHLINNYYSRNTKFENEIREISNHNTHEKFLFFCFGLLSCNLLEFSNNKSQFMSDTPDNNLGITQIQQKSRPGSGAKLGLDPVSHRVIIDIAFIIRFSTMISCFYTYQR